MNRLTTMSNDAAIIDTLDLGQQFTVKVNGVSHTIKAKPTWTGVSVDRFFEIAWRGWVVAIQAKIRQLSASELSELEKHDGVMDIAVLMEDKPNASLKEKVSKLEEDRTKEHIAMVKGVLPELLTDEARRDELTDVLKLMITDGVSTIFSYELK